jgi:hypothetical protein
MGGRRICDATRGRNALPTSPRLCRTSPRVRQILPKGVFLSPLFQTRTRGLVRHSRGGLGSASLPRSREAGVSLVELSVALFLLTTVAVFGFQTMISGWMLQNSSIMQSMTDAYAGIETAYAQRWTFADIPTSGRWPAYPASSSAVVTIGRTPKGPVNASVVRTSRQSTDALTGAQSYMLESYVVYGDELRNYCKVSKVYRSQ